MFPSSSLNASRAAVRSGAVAAGVSALGLALLSLETNDSLRTAATQCDSDKKSFQVMAKLELKEEAEKLRLAQLIHELHEIAKERQATKVGKRKVALRRYVTVSIKSKAPRRGSDVQASFSSPATDTIALPQHTETAVTSEMAQSMIESVTCGSKLSKESLISLIGASTEILKQESSLIDLRHTSDTVTVVGDLHGSLNSLLSVLHQVNIQNLTYQNRTIVFNGDFVDRGEESLQVMSILLLLKAAHPEKVVLLRGNHEDDLIASVYGFRDELRAKYGYGAADEIWRAMTHLFSHLPIMARTKTAAIVHGGIPATGQDGKPFCLDEIARISVAERAGMLTTAVTNGKVSEVTQNLLWSDPDASIDQGVEANPRGCGICFGPAVASSFLERHDLQYLVRSHEAVEDGFAVMDCENGRKVMTVFSAAGYPSGDGDNKGAIVHLSNTGSSSSYAVHAFAKDSTTVSSKSSIDGTGPKVGAKTILATSGHRASDCQNFQLNHQMLLTVFKFLDEDGNGSVDIRDFANGINVLNERLPGHRQLNDADALFKELDADGDGRISITEFQHCLD